MSWLLLRFLLPLGLLLSGFSFAERFVVYAFDPREVAPTSVGLTMKAEVITSPQGHKTVIWRAAPRPGRPTILYFHGNAGNLANRYQRFQIMLSRGYGVIAPAYPGSSGSAGWPTQELLIDTMIHVYKTVTDGQTVGPVVYGESLGAAVALQVVTRADVPAPRAVVLEAPFSTLADVGRSLDSWASALTPLLSSDWPSIKAAPKLAAPLMVIHGTKDPLIPIEQGRAVFKAASSPTKEFYAIKGAGHTNLWTVKSQRRFFAWIDRNARSHGVSHPNAVLRPKLPNQHPSR